MKPFYVHITDPSFREDSGYFYQVRGWPTAARQRGHFIDDWEAAMAACKKHHPDGWNVTDVIKLMCRWKWLMKACDFVVIHY